MSYAQVKDALHADQYFTEVSGFEEAERCPMIGTRNAYILTEMADSMNRAEKVDLRFFSRGGIRFRAENSKKVVDTIDDALKGGRDFWLLDGYYVTDDGLVLEMLPRHSCHLAECAQEAIADLSNQPGGFDYAEVEKHEGEIRTRFLRRVFVTGTFEAWENVSADDAVAISSNGKKMMVFEVEDMAKARKTAFDLTGKRPPRYFIYE